MTTSIDINTVSVKEAMSPATFTVTQTDKLDEVARIFEENGVHSAPVVDSVDRCVGIITSSDLVRFQSKLAEVNAQLDHGLSYEVVRNDSDGSIQVVEHPFDEVARHMTTCLQTIDQERSLAEASKIMCEQHIHHLIVLDDKERPSGILSSLDILTKLNG